MSTIITLNNKNETVFKVSETQAEIQGAFNILEKGDQNFLFLTVEALGGSDYSGPMMVAIPSILHMRDATV
jgi:hypothetical protein